MERIQQKQQKSAEKIKSSEKLSEPEKYLEKSSEKGKTQDVESAVKQKLLEMRVKEAKRKENEKNQQESEKTPEPNTSAIKELPAQSAFQQSYFVQFLNKKPNKEEAEKIIEIWNKIKPETQRSILKNPQYERLLNKASEISCDAEVEEQQSPKKKETPQKRTNEPSSEIEEDEEEMDFE